MASEKVTVITDGNFADTGYRAPRCRCSSTSGRNGAVPAGGWRRPWTPSQPITTGKATIGKLNVDDNPRTPFKFQIRGIPTLLLFKGGQVVESVVGLASDAEELTTSSSTSTSA